MDSYQSNKERETKKEYASLEAATTIFKDRELRTAPGTAFHYTSYGYVLLGMIIENVSGLSYAEYIQTHIWDKAGMDNTGIVVYNNAPEGSTEIYHRHRKNKIKTAEENNLSNRIPAGGFYTTAEDLLKFGQAIIDNTLVSEETLNLMIQHHSLEKYANGYGLGWFLYGPRENEGGLIGHSGAQTGVSSQLFIIPKRKMVFVILANTSGSWNDVIQSTANIIGVFNK